MRAENASVQSRALSSIGWPQELNLQTPCALTAPFTAWREGRAHGNDETQPPDGTGESPVLKYK
jgi:hypothetical protein